MQPLAMMCPAARIVNQAQARVFLRKESQSAQQPMVPWSMAWWSHRGVRKIIRVQLQYKPASWSIWETLYDDICNISYAFDLYCFYFALWYNYAIYTLYIYIYGSCLRVHTCGSYLSFNGDEPQRSPSIWDVPKLSSRNLSSLGC